jgi:hypothetical protein
MDWTIVYQVTVFLAIALLAVVVTIFVFASSLLGLAVESAAKEDKDRRAAQDSEIGKQVEQARRDLDKAKEGAGKFEQAAKTLRNLINKKRKFEKETKRIRQGYEVFTPKGGVLYPCIPLLVSLVLSALAWGFSMGTHQSVSPFLWGSGVAVLGFGLYRIYFGLKRIEKVAVTSEQAALTRMTRALGTALEKHDEAIKPRVKFEFRDKTPPFHIKKESTIDIIFRLTLTQGDFIRRAEVWFYAPQGFSFPDMETWFQSASFVIPSACTCKHVFTDMLCGIGNLDNLKLATPTKTGTYTLAYTVHCEGAKGEVQKFEVMVE